MRLFYPRQHLEAWLKTVSGGQLVSIRDCTSSALVGGGGEIDIPTIPLSTMRRSEELSLNKTLFGHIV